MELRTELAAGGHVAVLTALFDLEYLEARCRASLAALLEDLAYVLREAPTPLPADASFVHPSGAHVGRGAVAILEALVSVHRNRLQPARLFQFLYNELYWYDAPARAEHHDDPLAAPPNDWELWRWAEHARAIFEARPGACWLRSLRPPPITRTELPSWRLAPAARWRDDARPIYYYAKAHFSPNGATLVVDHEGNIGFWDTARGVIRTYADATKYIGTFARGCCVLGRQEDTLIAFAIEDGVELWRRTRVRSEVDYLHAADEVGLVLVEQSMTGVVALGIEDGELRYELAGEHVVVLDRDVLLTRTTQRTPGVSLRATATGAVSLELPTQDAGSFAISPDHRWLAACRNDIDLWDLKTQTLHRTITQGAKSFQFREDSAALITNDWVIHQSGNQDSNSEYVFDVVTGACVSSRGWSGDDDPEQGAPREIAPGILLEKGQLRVAGTELELPLYPIVCRTDGDEVLVASVFGRRVELYALKLGRPV